VRNVVTSLNPYIGYEFAARLAREALETGKSIRELFLVGGILTEEELNRILDSYKVTHPGRVYSVVDP
jgi:aspartate ammonia-lyase